MSTPRRRKWWVNALIALACGVVLGGAAFAVVPDCRVWYIGLMSAVRADDAVADMLADGDATVRGAALDSLIARKGAAVPALLRRLDRPDPASRQWAATAIGFIGPPAADAVPTLQAKLDGEPDPSVRIALQQALASIDSTFRMPVGALSFGVGVSSDVAELEIGLQMLAGSAASITHLPR